MLTAQNPLKTAQFTMQSVTTSQEKMTQENAPFLLIEDVSKVYPTPNGPYTVLEGVNLTVAEGEFVCIIGHSGCGKSTLLNMVAGFNQPSQGEVRLQAQPITQPGPDRMMVFQNYSLLPWKTAFENVYLAVNSVYPDKPKAEKIALVEEHLAMVGLTEAAHKKPQQLSGGMKQRVAIARALAIRPQVLILDEPFGALDAITKEELQEELLKIWQEHRLTVLMITHDIDEALFLADRLVMMTNGPSAHIGEVLNIPFLRPRVRARILEDPAYYELRNYALDFLYHRFAHSEDPTEETEIPAEGTGHWGKIAAIAGGLAVAAIVGFGAFQAFTPKPSQTPNQTPIEAPVGN
jgi:nitrate/nitrite transport system ATP-binding protein